MNLFRIWSLIAFLIWAPLGQADPPDPPLSPKARLYWDALMESPPRMSTDLRHQLVSGFSPVFVESNIGSDRTAFHEFINHPQVQQKISHGAAARERARTDLRRVAQDLISRLSDRMRIDLDYPAWVHSKIDAFLRQNGGLRTYTHLEAEREARRRLETMLHRAPDLSPGSPDLVYYRRLVGQIELEDNPLSRRHPDRSLIRKLEMELKVEARRRLLDFTSAVTRTYLEQKPQNRIYLSPQLTERKPAGLLYKNDSVDRRQISLLRPVSGQQFDQYRFVIEDAVYIAIDSTGARYEVYLHDNNYFVNIGPGAWPLFTENLIPTQGPNIASNPRTISSEDVLNVLCSQLITAKYGSFSQACANVDCLREPYAGRGSIEEQLVHERLKNTNIQANDSADLQTLRNLVAARDLTEPAGAMKPKLGGPIYDFKEDRWIRREIASNVGERFRNWILSRLPNEDPNVVRSAELSNEVANTPREGLDRIRFYRIENGELSAPGFFEVATADEPASRISLSYRRRLAGSITVAPTGRVASSEGRISIPTPDGHSLTGIALQNELGQNLELGRDFYILKSNRSDAVLLEIVVPTTASYRYSASFQRRPSSQPPLPRIPDVDLIRLSRVIDDLREAGLNRLADSLENRLRQALRSRRPVQLADIESAVRQTSRYSDIPAQLLPQLVGRSRYSRYRDFLDSEGRTCIQCDGANSILSEIINDLTPAGMAPSRVRVGFSYSGGSYLTAADAHAQTAYQVTSDRTVIFDGTPSVRDRRDPKTIGRGQGALADAVPTPVSNDLLIANATHVMNDKRRSLIKTLQENRYVPADSTEPGSRALRLSDLMARWTRGDADLEQVNAALRALGREPANTPEDVSVAIAQAAKAVETRLSTLSSKSKSTGDLGHRNRFEIYHSEIVRQRISDVLHSIEVLSELPLAGTVTHQHERGSSDECLLNVLSEAIEAIPRSPSR